MNRQKIGGENTLKSFHQFASINAFLAGVSSLAYAYFFVVTKDPFIYNIFLMLSGLFAVKVMVALYERLKDVNSGFALIALVLGLAGAIGTAVHGGFDLAMVINPPSIFPSDVPNQLDPRGILAFGATGLALFYISWLMGKTKEFPKNLSLLGFVSGVLLIWIYLARLTILNPTNPALLYPILLEGFIVNPIWYLWLGSVLGKEK